MRTRIVLLVVVCVVPLSALNLGTQFISYRDARETAGHRTLELARTLSLALNRELQARIALLQVLGLSRRLEEGDIDGFRSQADGLLSQQQPGAAILLLRENGQVVMSTELASGATLPVQQNLETIHRVFTTAHPSVSNLSSTDGRPAVAIEVPVLGPHGDVAYALSLNPPFSVFTDIIRLQQPSEGWVAALLDAQGTIVARVPGDFVGQRAASGFLEQLLTESESIVESISREGTPVLSAFSHTPDFGWSAGVGVPKAILTAQIWRAALSSLGVGLIVLLAGLAMAGIIARRITRPIAALRRLAAAVEGELPSEPLAYTLPETAEVADALTLAARERHLALEAGAVGIFNWDLNAGHLRWDARMHAIWAIPMGVPANITTFYRGIHRDDRKGVRTLFESASRSREGRTVAIEYRVVGLADGVQRSVATRGRVIFEGGRPARLVGTVIDITDRRAAEERQALLMREVDHRAKNVLAVVQSIVCMTPRTVPQEEFAASIEGRITAMARAHSVLSSEQWVGADLQAIAEGETALHAGLVEMDGPAVRLAPEAAQPIGIVLHELVANASKHGALSLPGGTLRLSWRFQADSTLRLSWDEQGGPVIAMAPTLAGFGSRLILSLAERQLGCTLERQWRPVGLFMVLVLPSKHARGVPGAARLTEAETARR